MAKYLLIRNKGLAPIESFTILGLSTSRGDADKIGQFGSGSKHGTLNLLRNGIQPRIFIGADELAFSTHPAKMLEKDYQEVRYTFQDQQHKTGMCLEFGAIDWNDITMSLREFICNALDQGEPIDGCAVIVDEIGAADDETRVYVPLDNDEIRAYAENLPMYFLHFDKLEKTEIFPARSEDVQFFRRGVFVRKVPASGSQNPLFAYNFQDGRIDESRNLDGAAMGAIAARLLRKSQPHLEQIIRTFTGAAVWEHTLGSYLHSYHRKDMEPIERAWKAVFGDLPFSSSDEITLSLIKKGIKHVVIPIYWGNTLKCSGVKDGRDLLSTIDHWGGDVVEATETAIATFKRAWGWIESVRLTSGKPFPEVGCFTLAMNMGSEKVGYYKDGTVFLNLDYDSNEQAAVEELAHYITGSGDETRDFQDFAFKLATRLAKLREVKPVVEPIEEINSELARASRI